MEPLVLLRSSQEDGRFRRRGPGSGPSRQLCTIVNRLFRGIRGRTYIMSSTTITDPEHAALGRVGEHPPEASHGGIGERVLSRLDVFLSEPLRNALPEESSRYRVLVVIALMLLLINGLLLLCLPFSPQPLAHGTFALIAGTPALIALALLRRRSSPELSALLICSGMTFAFALICLVGTRPYAASHAGGMLVSALSVYLLGARSGLVLTVLLGVFVGVIHPLHVMTSGRVSPIPPGLWFSDAFAALCMLGLWAVSWLHTTARQQAHTARAQALRTLHESERKLHSLIENTEDLVCSLDTEGRLVVGNSAMRRAFREQYGREPVVGESLIDREASELYQGWWQNISRAFSGERVRVEHIHEAGGRTWVIDITIHPVFDEDGKPLGLTLFGRDITERKESETKLREMHRTLLDVSRQAGMAEVATGLLHNVGNTLNSVNVSANLVTERLQGLRVVGRLTRVAQLLREHSTDLCTFLSQDPGGQQLPAYLIALSEQLVEEQQALLSEQRTLTERLEHVKSIIGMQQEHARFSGVLEQLPVPRLIDDALRLHSDAFERLGIQLHREYADVPPILLDRHKLLQILLNLLSNARHALIDSGRPDKRLTIRVAPGPDARLRIQVSDNGVGIAPESATRLFTQGFTTKKDGHGFGLHISALAAAELSGSLTCTSEGPGQGATFTLELPMRREDVRG